MIPPKRPVRREEPDDEPKGLVCRRCECEHFLVIYTRKQLGKIVRRRECRNCGLRISTTERETGA